MADTYSCTLEEADIEKAQKELNEDPKNRLAAVDTLRSWVKQQEHMTYTAFLLRFLRHAKFSQLRAREVLENYLRVMDKYPQYLQNIDTQEDGIKNFFARGTMYPLPGYDPEGRKVLCFNPGLVDVTGKSHSLDDILRATCVTVLHDMSEHLQVNGVVLFIDHSKFTFKHTAYMNLDFIKKHVGIFMNNFPVRFKEIHVYNAGSFFETIFTAISSILKKKIRDRFHLHGDNMENVYQHIPMHMFPSEYLPDDYKGKHAGSTQDVIDAFQKELTSSTTRQEILRQTGSLMKYDSSKKDESLPQESYMKVDAE